MAITLSATTALNPIRPNVYRFNVAHYGTGDASGGAASVAQDIAPFIKRGDIVYIDAVTTEQGSAATTAFMSNVYKSDWSALHAGVASHSHLFAVVPSGGWQSAGGLYYPDPSKAFLPFPILLGQLLTASANLETYFNTNTNAAIYRVNYNLTIIRHQ